MSKGLVPKKRGFALLDDIVRIDLSKKGAQASVASGKAHRYDRIEAKMAGKKGGLSTSANRNHMSIIGRKGGRVKRNDK